MSSATESQLIDALKRGDLAFSREFLDSGGDVNAIAVSVLNRTLLQQAVCCNKPDIVALLIESGADM